MGESAESVLALREPPHILCERVERKGPLAWINRQVILQAGSLTYHKYNVTAATTIVILRGSSLMVGRKSTELLLRVEESSPLGVQTGAESQFISELLQFRFSSPADAERWRNAFTAHIDFVSNSR